MNKFSRKTFQKLSTRSALILTQQMGFMTISKPAAHLRALVNVGSVRRFASYPHHIVLEMPNLSPTMEKVTYLHSLLIIISFIGKYRVME